jgi:hypothetical protein
VAPRKSERSLGGLAAAVERNRLLWATDHPTPIGLPAGQFLNDHGKAPWGPEHPDVTMAEM